MIWSCLMMASTLLGQSHRVSTVAGRDTVIDSRPPLEAVLETPSAMLVDRNGVLYIADASRHRVYKITPDPGRIGPETQYAFGSFAAAAGAGEMFFSGDGGPALESHLASPNGIALAAGGTLYIAGTNNNRVRAVSPNGEMRTVATGLALPFGIAVNAEGVVYVSDLQGGLVRRIEPDGSLTTVAERLVRPMGLAFDRDGSLLIAGSGMQRTHRLNSDGGLQGFAETGERSIPRSVAVDTEGNVYAGEPSMHRVRATAPGGVVRTLAGTGVRGFSGDGGPAAEPQLASPQGIAACPEGVVYIAGTGNNRLHPVTAQGIIETLAAPEYC